MRPIISSKCHKPVDGMIHASQFPLGQSPDQANLLILPHFLRAIDSWRWLVVNEAAPCDLGRLVRILNKLRDCFLLQLFLKLPPGHVAGQAVTMFGRLLSGRAIDEIPRQANGNVLVSTRFATWYVHTAEMEGVRGPPIGDSIYQIT